MKSSLLSAESINSTYRNAGSYRTLINHSVHLFLLARSALMAFSLHPLATGESTSDLFDPSISLLVVRVVLCSKLASLLHVGKTCCLVLFTRGLPWLRAGNGANGSLEGMSERPWGGLRRTYLCGSLDVLDVAADETGLLVVVVGHFEYSSVNAGAWVLVKIKTFGSVEFGDMKKNVNTENRTSR